MEIQKMIRIFGYLAATFIWLEGVYHIGVYGLNDVQPVLLCAFVILVAAFETLLVRLTKKRAVNLGILWGVQGLNFFLFAAQVVYHKIFTRPLLLELAFTTGGDAIADFWMVALDGIVRSMIPILFMAIPLIVMAILLKKNILVLEQNKGIEFVGNGCALIGGALLVCLVLVVSFYSEDEFYGEYQEFYAPDEVAKEYGALALYGRQLMFDLLPAKDTDVWQGGIPVVDGNDYEGTEGSEGIVETEGTESTENTESTESTENTEGSTELEDDTVVIEPVVDTSPNVLNINFDTLCANGDKNIDKLADIMQNMTPSKKNEYTGMMEGYNLIYITAEAFSPYAISEELTPTLYKMVNSGVVVKDYYIPLWDTSTSDGEYVNLMGQIPDGLHSFKRSAQNTYPYALPKYFEAEGVKSYAYHNNSLSYYDRHKTHPNLGYDFKAALRGKAPKAEFADKVFKMKDAGIWPSSDYEMMVATVPEWIDDERFYAYYMSLSGHCNYNWTGNQMCAKNKKLVKDLDCSEQMKAYIACNYELERAVTYLVEQLELAGKLEKTLIVISADHHPYGMKNVKSEMEAFNGTEMTDLDVQRNCLIMWNSQMEPVHVEKTCSAIDILPTIMNLLGFEYDSRLFAGRDILSDSPSMVVFSNRSFITDKVIYDEATDEAISRTGEAISKDYIKSMKAYVKTMFQYSKGILDYGFDEAVYKAQEMH